MHKLFLTLAGIVGTLTFFHTVVAAQSDFPLSPAKASILSEKTAVQPGKPVRVAVRLEMESGWHTYWKNPGDSGLSTQVDWSFAPETKKPAIIAGPLWPSPLRFDQGGLIGYGYEGEAWLLYTITPPGDLKIGSTYTLKAEVQWLACKEACVPGNATLSLVLPVAKTSAPSSDAEQIANLFRALPRDPTTEGATVWFEKSSAPYAYALRLMGSVPEGAALYFFSENAADVDGSAPQVAEVQGDGVTLRLKAQDNAPAVKRLAGVLEIRDGQGIRAWSVQGPLLDAPPKKQQLTAAADPSLSLVLLYAYVGGLILNIMPCVLPVIALKIFQFVRQGAEDPRAIFRHGLVFSAGILLSFLALAAVLLLAREGGERLGWGFQFQSPGFLLFMVALVFALGLSLFGVFEVGGGLTGVGQSLSYKEGMAGSFFSGVLATTLATPCTAPFMGAAVGFALAQSPVVTLWVFLFLGLGMATPYLILASDPRLVRFVPKPGAWMLSFKQFTGFFMVGTALWLLGVLQAHIAGGGLVQVLAFLLVLALGCWVLGTWGGVAATPISRWLARATALALVAGSYWLFANPVISEGKIQVKLQPKAQQGKAPRGGIAWQEWSPEAVQSALAAGKDVFVDFTADWCLTCKVNEAVTLKHASVVKLFDDGRLVPMKADWTHKDERITSVLKSLGRSGVPVYLFYRAADPENPVVLPEVLTPDLVANTLLGKK